MSTKIKLFVEVPQKVGSTVREATAEEMRRGQILRGEIDAKRISLKHAQGELNRSEAKCKHVLIYDAPGYECDIRTCWVCGADLGLI